MTISRVETIEIKDESEAGVIKHQLYVDGQRRGCLTKKSGQVKFHWQVYGPLSWPESKNLLQGFLELSILADSLTGTNNGKKIHNS